VVHVVVVILSTITVYGLTEEWFMLFLLYFLPLLFKVWQRSGSCSCCYIVYHYCLWFGRSGSCCGCYIFYHYCLWFDRGVVHVVAILSTSSASDLTEKWFTLLLYFLPLLFKVWLRSSSRCGCYLVNHYCLRFDKGVVHVVFVILSTITVYGLTEEWFMLLLLYCLPLLFMVWQRSGSRWGCYIVYHYCLRFDRRVVHVVVVILSTITIYGMTEEWFLLLLLYCLPLLFKVWQRSGSWCGCYIVYHYCLRFDSGVIHVVVIFSTSTV
jgi:hypothetical protein